MYFLIHFKSFNSLIHIFITNDAAREVLKQIMGGPLPQKVEDPLA